MNARFGGKTVLISGAAGGFGSGAARAFAQEGAKLFLTDIDSAKLGKLAAELNAEALAGDIADPAFHKVLLEAAVARLGRIDIAINNAGIAHPPQPLSAMDRDVTRRVIDVDLLAVVWAMQSQISHMTAQGGGVIVNIASVAGIGGAPGLSVYAAAKHGVVGLTKSAAAESARFNIRINAICPAFVRTQMVEDMLPDGDAESAKKLVQAIPMRRVGQVDEIVTGILWAADPDNSFLTGQAIALDGGLTAV